MSNSPNPGAPMTDAFTQFWSDFMSRMGTGIAPQPTAGADATKRMQRIFFDAMAKYADDFMRSPQFLESLKQTMDNALAFRRQMDQWLANSLNAVQMPSHGDVTDVVARVHSVERRVLERLDELEHRIAALEGDGAEPVAVATGRTGPRDAKRKAGPSKGHGKN